MLSSCLIRLLLLANSSRISFASHVQDAEVVLASQTKTASISAVDGVDQAILAALAEHPDPVDALVSLSPDRAAELAEPRLLHVFGEPQPEWLTEGDKLRLRRRGKRFMDITDHQDFYAQQVDAKAGKACRSTEIEHESVSVFD